MMATRERTAADQHLEMPYEISLVRRPGEDGGGWHAQVDELPGCEATGATEEEALSELRVAMSDWISGARESGRPIPQPKAAATHSGRLLVRMPPTLHADLARMADKEKVSLNTLIVGILGGSISWRTADGKAGPNRAPTANGSADPEVDDAAGRRRFLSVALAANLAVVVIAGLLAIGLLVALIVR